MNETKKTVTIFVEMQNCTLDVSLMFCLAFDRHTNTLKGIAHRFFFSFTHFLSDFHVQNFVKVKVWNDIRLSKIVIFD